MGGASIPEILSHSHIGRALEAVTPGLEINLGRGENQGRICRMEFYSHWSCWESKGAGLDDFREVVRGQVPQFDRADRRRESVDGLCVSDVT